jgi:putative endonuclease
VTDRRTPRKRLGDFGEDHAAHLLAGQGHQIIARGWRCTAGEIDLVTLDGEELVFVEVRTRRGERYGSPEESIAGAKAARLLRLGDYFLQAHPAHERRIWRIDLVAIVLDRAGRLVRVAHHPNAVGE